MRRRCACGSRRHSIAARATSSSRSATASDPLAEIHGLIVEEEERGGGLGARLVAAAEAWAVERGMTRIRVRSNVARERTRKFYEKHGYTVTKTSNVFDKMLE